MSKEQKFFSLWLHATLGDTEAQFQLGQYYSTNKVGEGKSYKADGIRKQRRKIIKKLN